jgi:hypothetical protein
MTFLQGLDEGSALFELAEGGSMEPDPVRVRFLSLSKDRFFYDRPFDGLRDLDPTPFDPLHRLGMAEEGGDADAEGIEQDTYSIENSHVSFTLTFDPDPDQPLEGVRVWVSGLG